MHGRGEVEIPLSIWVFVLLEVAQVCLAVLSGWGVSIVGVLLVCGLLLLMLVGFRAARWLLLAIVILGIYVGWALQDTGGPAGAEVIAAALGVGQVCALLMPASRRFGRRAAV